MAIDAAIQDADQPKLVQMSRSELSEQLINLSVKELELNDEYEALKAEGNSVRNNIKKVKEERRKLLNELQSGQQKLTIVAALPSDSDLTTPADDFEIPDDFDDEQPGEDSQESTETDDQVSEEGPSEETEPEATEDAFGEPVNEADYIDLEQARSKRKAKG